MEQDKGCRVVIMDMSKYHEKCLTRLENDNYKTPDHDPTKKNEEKIQFYRKQKTDYYDKDTSVYTHVDLVPVSFME